MSFYMLILIGKIYLQYLCLGVWVVMDMDYIMLYYTLVIIILADYLLKKGKMRRTSHEPQVKKYSEGNIKNTKI